MATLYILFGKSTAGKDTLVQLLEDASLVRRVVRTTSRPIREGEVDGVNYHYTTIIPSEDDFVEHNIYNGWFYGTRAQDIVDILETGSDAIIVGEWNMAIKILRSFNKITSRHRLELIYLNVSKDKQIERIKLRGEEHYEEGMRRIQSDKTDYPSFLEESPIYSDENKDMAIINGYVLYSLNADNPLEEVLKLASEIITKKGAQPKHD